MNCQILPALCILNHPDFMTDICTANTIALSLQAIFFLCFCLHLKFVFFHSKNEIEMELARSRLDMVHLDQQLLEAVQQKLDLSQQLELWQVNVKLVVSNKYL